MSLNTGPSPTDANGARAASGYTPGTGTVSFQTGPVTYDNANQPSAPMVTQSRVSDASGNPLGTVGNPLATNQLVGTSKYATNTAVAAAACAATLPAAAGKTTYLNGFVCTSHAPAGNVFGTVTVSFDGGTTAHLQFIYLESQTLGGMLNIDFPDPIPATAPNTSIVVTIPAITSGAASAVSVFGYQL